VLLPGVAIHEQVIQRLWNRTHELSPQHADTVALPDHFVVAPILEDLFLKGRHEPYIDVHRSAGSLQAKVHAEELVAVGSVNVLGQALIVPYHDRLVPEAKIHDRRSIAGPVVHRCVKTLAIIHGEA